MQLKSHESAQGLLKGESVTEDQQQYYFGIRNWHPQWMQRAFANAKFFTFILCVNGLVEGALASGESSANMQYTIGRISTSHCSPCMHVIVISTLLCEGGVSAPQKLWTNEKKAKIPPPPSFSAAKKAARV